MQCNDFQPPMKLSTSPPPSIFVTSTMNRSSKSPIDQQHQLCAICTDKATGKHYGSFSCDGCKGFFRRTVRRKQHYTCRFESECIVDRDHRNACRCCRFDKCIQVGMRPEAVQNERDRISSKHIKRTTSAAHRSRGGGTIPAKISPPSSHQTPPNNYIDVLLKAEAVTKHLRNTVILRTADQLSIDESHSEPMRDGVRVATTSDVTTSMHQQLMLMVEWAKTLPAFTQLPIEHQISLLRHYSGQHLAVCAGFRSKHMHEAVYLTNETCLPRDSPRVPDLNRVGARILDHLTRPMRDIQMDESEYVALKAIAFFNPSKGVEKSQQRINDTRQEILAAFEYYVIKVSPQQHIPHRFGNLLLLLPPILAIARDLVEDVQLARLFGLANVDSLMSELMLPEDESHPPTYSPVESSRSRPIDHMVIDGSKSTTTTALSTHALRNKVLANKAVLSGFKCAISR